jgi:hypothetical protein
MIDQIKLFVAKGVALEFSSRCHGCLLEPSKKTEDHRRLVVAIPQGSV